MNKNILFFTVPFNGHFNVIQELARQCSVNNNVTLVICSWETIDLPKIDHTLTFKLFKSQNIPSSSPIEFTFIRITDIIDEVINYCNQPIDYIIYDFFTLEGYIISELFRIPAICSIPAIFGLEFNYNYFNKGINYNQTYITSIENKYDVKIFNQLSLVSDGFLIPGDFNLLWVPKSFYNNDLPVNLTNIIHLYNDVQKLDNKENLVYVSFGTVVTGNLWNNNHNVREYLYLLYKSIGDLGVFNPHLKFIISIPHKAPYYINKLNNLPSNVEMVSFIDQKTILKRTRLFITHGGGNSVREAIMTKTPMLVLPFFGDQYDSAMRITKLGIGCSMISKKDIDTTKSEFNLDNLNNFNKIFNLVWNNLSQFEFNYQYLLNNDNGVSVDNFRLPLNIKWKEGDLLYGTNIDRLKFAKLLKREDYYQIKPFSTLANINNGSLPRLIDQYHDVINNNSAYNEEIKSNTEYSQWL